MAREIKEPPAVEWVTCHASVLQHAITHLRDLGLTSMNSVVFDLEEALVGRPAPPKAPEAPAYSGETLDQKMRLERIARKVRQHGEQAITDAGYRGSMTDGGGEAWKREAHAFLCGLEWGIPASWKQFEAEDAREQDPEYQDFLRLKAKFGT